jgi:hypothetical protein
MKIKSTKTILRLFGILAVLLPINNLITQVAINLLHLPAVFLLWKEFMAVLLIVFVYIEVSYAFKSNQVEKKIFIPTVLYITAVMSALLSSVSNQIPLKEIMLGFRVELLWVGLFVATFTWLKSAILSTNDIVKYIKTPVYIGFGFVFTLVVASVVLTPQTLYTSLGYSNGWESINNTLLESPICHSIDAAGSGCRLSGGFSNPNNFAGYLIFILPLFIIDFIEYLGSKSYLKACLFGAILFIILLMLGLSYARFSWLILIISLILGITLYLEAKFKSGIINNGLKINYILFLVLPILIIPAFGLVSANISQLNFLPSYILKTESTLDHYKQTFFAGEVVKNRALDLVFGGYGLGQTGPIAKPQYKDVILSKFATQNSTLSDKYGIRPWEVGVPENWYLQLILNGGILYFFIILYLIYPALKPLVDYKRTNIRSYLLGLGFYGIFVANLFLHIWESPTISYYFSILYILLNFYQYKYTHKSN